MPDFQYDSHISLNNSCSNNSTLNEYEFDCYDYILMRLGLMCMGHFDLGPTYFFIHNGLVFVMAFYRCIPNERHRLYF